MTQAVIVIEVKRCGNKRRRPYLFPPRAAADLNKKQNKTPPQNSPDLLSSPWRRQLCPRHPPPLLQSTVAMTPRPPLPSLSPPVSLALILSFISSCQVSSRRPRSLYPSFLLSRSGRVINMEGGGPPKPLDPPRLFFIFIIPTFFFGFFLLFFLFF